MAAAVERDVDRVSKWSHPRGLPLRAPPSTFRALVVGAALALASLVQALLRGRQERQARGVRVRMLLPEVEDPPVHRRHEPVVAAGAVRRPGATAADGALGAADLVDEATVGAEIDPH